MCFVQAMYPMHDMIRGKVFEAPLPDPHLFATPPTMHLISRTIQGWRVSGGAAGGLCTAGETERLNLEMRLPQPGVGVLNVTGSIQDWSFSDPLPKSATKVCSCKGIACHLHGPSVTLCLYLSTRVCCCKSIVSHMHGPFVTFCF